MLIELSRLHTFNQSIERRDELIFARHDDCRFAALLELDRLCPVANSQSNSPKCVLAPPRRYPLLLLNEFLAPASLRTHFETVTTKLPSWASRFCCSRRWISFARRARTGFCDPLLITPNVRLFRTFM